MKVIRDSIHGDIFLTQLEMDVIDTPQFQRLRRLKQLGTTYMVYPSANHTRFEHSLGALHLAGRIAERLGLSIEDRINLRLAALLHDIGHGPLSHTSEELLERYLGKSHEKATEGIIQDSRVAGVLEDGGVSPRDVTRVLSGQTQLKKLISSDFDVDRMDYLVRDAHHTGVAYGIIDLDRLVNTLELTDDDIVINERGLRAVEALLVARFLMIPTVYLHHTSRIVDSMFLHATERAIEEGIFDYHSLVEMDDYDIQNVLRNSPGYVGEIGERFDRRRLFKKAQMLGWKALGDEMRDRLMALRRDIKTWKRLESEISADCGTEEGYVLVDIPPGPDLKEMGTRIVKDGEFRRIEDESLLVRILREAQKGQWSVGVYCPEELVEKVRGVELEAYLG
ncbi:MAG: HD domain-containing protein [Euryarchaeota archaeon]|nr:HD domain-containing protein [Euryarchaeota archaeon]